MKSNFQHYFRLYTLAIVVGCISLPIESFAGKISIPKGGGGIKNGGGIKGPRGGGPHKPPTNKPSRAGEAGGTQTIAHVERAAIKGPGSISGATAGVTVQSGLDHGLAAGEIIASAPPLPTNSRPIAGKPLDADGAHLGKDYRTIKPGELYVNTKTGRTKRVDQSGEPVASEETVRTPDRFVVDSRGNTIPLNKGEYVTGSKDGRWIQVRDASGNPTGVRIDGAHRSHSDPRALQPHAHIPGATNSDGTPWLPIK